MTQKNKKRLCKFQNPRLGHFLLRFLCAGLRVSHSWYVQVFGLVCIYYISYIFCVMYILFILLQSVYWWGILIWERKGRYVKEWAQWAECIFCAFHRAVFNMESLWGFRKRAISNLFNIFLEESGLKPKVNWGLEDTSGILVTP